MGNTLKQLRAAKGWTQQEAADALSMSKSGYVKWELGDRRLNDASINRIATVFEVEAAQVLNSPRLVEIVGQISPNSAGDIIFSTQEGQFGWAPVPPDSRDSVAALRVLGDSMLGVAEDGWVIYFESGMQPIQEEMIGELCVVWLVDGRAVVRRPYHSRIGGRFDLERAGAATLREQDVKGASFVTWIAPKRTARLPG